jgi:hypothetical protein
VPELGRIDLDVWDRSLMEGQAGRDRLPGGAIIGADIDTGAMLSLHARVTVRHVDTGTAAWIHLDVADGVPLPDVRQGPRAAAKRPVLGQVRAIEGIEKAAARQAGQNRGLRCGESHLRERLGADGGLDRQQGRGNASGVKQRRPGIAAIGGGMEAVIGERGRRPIRDARRRCRPCRS